MERIDGCSFDSSDSSDSWGSFDSFDSCSYSHSCSFVEEQVDAVPACPSRLSLSLSPSLSLLPPPALLPTGQPPEVVDR